jgi:hypothetical protein
MRTRNLRDAHQSMYSHKSAKSALSDEKPSAVKNPFVQSAYKSYKQKEQRSNSNSISQLSTHRPADRNAKQNRLRNTSTHDLKEKTSELSKSNKKVSKPYKTKSTFMPVRQASAIVDSSRKQSLGRVSRQSSASHSRNRSKFSRSPSASRSKVSKLCLAPNEDLMRVAQTNLTPDFEETAIH